VSVFLEIEAIHDVCQLSEWNVCGVFESTGTNMLLLLELLWSIPRNTVNFSQIKRTTSCHMWFWTPVAWAKAIVFQSIQTHLGVSPGREEQLF
jgi:hypothetical protein